MDIQNSSLADNKTQALTDAFTVESKGEGVVDSDAALLECEYHVPANTAAVSLTSRSDGLQAAA